MAILKGLFKENEMHGSGVYRYADGDTYDGELLHGRPHGHGVYTKASGERFEGEFQHGAFTEPSKVLEST
jgi:hypothetical protein